MNKLAIFTLVAVGLVTGCGAQPGAEESRKEIGRAEQGLTVLAESMTEGLNGRFVEGNDVVFFETLKDEDGPGWSMRWSDVDGRGILSDYNAAHGSANDKWPDPEPTREVALARIHLLDVVLRAAEALDQRVVAPEVVHLQKGLVSLTSNIPPADKRIVRLPTTVPSEPAAEGEIGSSNTGKYKQRFRVIDSGVLGAHQCTAWENYYLDTNGSYYYYNYLLNRNGHGDTPSCDKNNCGYVWSSVHGYKTKSHSSGEQFGSGPACGTPYNLYPGVTGKHNCRSDAKRQTRYVMANILCSSTGGFCNISQGLLMGADCSTNTSCSN